MGRITIWFAATATAVALLFGYRTSTAGPGLPTTTTAAATDASTTGTGTTFTGTEAQTRWGPVQVRLTVDGGRITAVDVVESPDGNGRDREINDRALPVLVRDTLSAQSAAIDMVSGATVSSTGYLTSLQSALDQAGLS